MMPYLEVLVKLQSRPQSHAAKLAVQRFVELFANGISDGDLEPSIVYFQTAESRNQSD
jgi:hypothetical protein